MLREAGISSTLHNNCTNGKMQQMFVLEFVKPEIFLCDLCRNIFARQVAQKFVDCNIVLSKIDA